MAIDTSFWASDLAAMIADLPVSAKFGAASFTCSATELSSEETLILVGNNTKRAVRVTFPVTSFTVDASFKPQARLQLKFPTPSAFSNYQIVDIKLAPDFTAYEVILKADNQVI